MGNYERAWMAYWLRVKPPVIKGISTMLLDEQVRMITEWDVSIAILPDGQTAFLWPWMDVSDVKFSRLGTPGLKWEWASTPTRPALVYASANFLVRAAKRYYNGYRRRRSG